MSSPTDAVFEEVEAETYRELRAVPDVDLGPDHVAMRDPRTGELFSVERASIAPPGVMLSAPPPAEDRA